MRTGLRGVLSTHPYYLQAIALGSALDSLLYLGVRPTTALSVQPRQVLNSYVCIVLICYLHYLACDALANLVFNVSGLSADSLRFSSQDLSVLVPIMTLAEICLLIKIVRQISTLLFLPNQRSEPSLVISVIWGRSVLALRINDCSDERLNLAQVYTNDLLRLSLVYLMLDSDVKDNLALVVQSYGGSTKPCPY